MRTKYDYTLKYNGEVHVGGIEAWMKPQIRPIKGQEGYKEDEKYTKAEKLMFELFEQGCGRPGACRILKDENGEPIARIFDGTQDGERKAGFGDRIKWSNSFEARDIDGKRIKVQSGEWRHDSIGKVGASKSSDIRPGQFSYATEEILDHITNQWRWMERGDEVLLTSGSQSYYWDVNLKPTTSKTSVKRIGGRDKKIKNTPIFMGVWDANLTKDLVSKRFAEEQLDTPTLEVMMWPVAKTMRLVGITKTSGYITKPGDDGELIDTAIPRGVKNTNYAARRIAREVSEEHDNEYNKDALPGKDVWVQELSMARAIWDAKIGNVIMAMGGTSMLAFAALGYATGAKLAGGMGTAASVVAGSVGAIATGALGLMLPQSVSAHSAFRSQEERESGAESIKKSNELKHTIMGVKYLKNAMRQNAKGQNALWYYASGGRVAKPVSLLSGVSAGYLSAKGIVSAAAMLASGGSLVGGIALGALSVTALTQFAIPLISSTIFGRKAVDSYNDEVWAGKGKNEHLAEDELLGKFGRVHEWTRKTPLGKESKNTESPAPSK